MNTEQVVEKILQQARQEADKIVADAQAKRDAQVKQWHDELARFQQQTEQMAQAAAEDKRQRLLAAARMENAKRLLAAKNELLDQLFERAKQQILQLPDDAYRTLMTKLMIKAVQSGDEEVIIGKNETRINDDLVKQVNRQLGPGFKGNLRLSTKRADIAGGFILSGGKVQVNASIDVLLSQAREALEIELAKKLFG